MSEVAFINAVLTEADCDLLLDINNLYVNSQNHHYDPMEFLSQLDAGSVCYFHIAGHFKQDDGIIVDTHGADVIDPVWRLLDSAYQRFGARPTLLERDFNLPSLGALKAELQLITSAQESHSALATGRLVA